MSNYSNPSASWQRRWLDDGWLVLGVKQVEGTTVDCSDKQCRLSHPSRYLRCPGVSDLEQILLLVPRRP